MVRMKVSEKEWEQMKQRSPTLARHDIALVRSHRPERSHAKLRVSQRERRPVEPREVSVRTPASQRQELAARDYFARSVRGSRVSERAINISRSIPRRASKSITPSNLRKAGSLAVKAGKAVGSGLVHVGRGVKNEITEYQTKKIRLAIQRRKDWEALPKHLRRELLEEAREEKARKELARYRRQKHDIELADRRLSYHGGNRDTRQPVRRKQPSEADDLARIFGSGYIGGRRTKYSDRDLIGI